MPSQHNIEDNSSVSWVAKQAESVVSQWDNAIELHYPEFLKMWRDPEENYRCLHEKWNLLNAVKLVDWKRYLDKEHCTILELGAGTGWLTAYLSKFQNVSSILAIDSSEYFIKNMIPHIISKMGGDSSKIRTVKGLFTPILLDSNCLDYIVASSALHHADNLENTLVEANRVLKENGILFILNEMPYSTITYLHVIMKQFIKIMGNSAFKKYRGYSQQISSAGFLYDPLLGDKGYPLWYWKKALNAAHFIIIDIIETPFYPLQADKKGIFLHHIICKKTAR
jgi:SAM-dependent methyltransferase